MYTYNKSRQWNESREHSIKNVTGDRQFIGQRGMRTWMQALSSDDLFKPKPPHTTNRYQSTKPFRSTAPQEKSDQQHFCKRCHQRPQMWHSITKTKPTSCTFMAACWLRVMNRRSKSSMVKTKEYQCAKYLMILTVKHITIRPMKSADLSWKYFELLAAGQTISHTSPSQVGPCMCFCQ